MEATNNIEPLISLVSATYGQITSSQEVIGGMGIIRPLLLELLEKYIHEGFTDKDVLSFLNEQ